MNIYLNFVPPYTFVRKLIALNLLPWAFCGTCFLNCAGNRAVQVPVRGVAPVVLVGASQSQEAPPPYRLSALDEVEFRVKYHDRLNDVTKVRPDGRITLPEAGDLYVAGMTTAELDSAIASAYASLVHEPEVTVFVRNFGNQVVYVLGEVKSPGVQELKPHLSVLQALASASGPIRGAKLSNVVLLRRGSGGEVQARLLNLDRGNIPEARIEDAYLQPEDIVFVPKTLLATINEFLVQFYDGVFPPFDIYLRALREYNRQ